MRRWARIRSRGPVGTMVVLVVVALWAAPAGAAAGFGDVGEDEFFAPAVQWMGDSDITEGVSPSCFVPGATVSRGETAAFLWRMEGSPEPVSPHGFDDVVEPWQDDAVAWLREQGVTEGTSATTYSPARAVTRGEPAVMMWRLAGQPTDAPPHGFTDVGGWIDDAVAWMKHEGITNGVTPTMFVPGAGASRGEVAVFLHRYEGSPSVVVDPAAARCWPWHDPRLAHATPEAAVADFVAWIGFENASVGEFRQGDSRSGEIEVTTPSSGFPAGPCCTTTVLVRMDARDAWVVIGAVSDLVQVDVPSADAEVVSPLASRGVHGLISFGLRVSLWPDGAAAPVGDVTFPGGGVFAFGEWSLPMPFARPGVDQATFVAASLGGSGVRAVTTVPVAFG